MLVSPAERRKAGMSRDNLADPRWAWIKAAKHPIRQQSDCLSETKTKSSISTSCGKRAMPGWQRLVFT